MASYICNFDLSLFPFDVHECHVNISVMNHGSFCSSFDPQVHSGVLGSFVLLFSLATSVLVFGIVSFAVSVPLRCLYLCVISVCLFLYFCVPVYLFCVYVFLPCLCVFLYLCVCLSLSVFVYICVCVCLCVYVSLCVRACVRACFCVYIHITFTFIYAYTYTFTVCKYSSLTIYLSFSLFPIPPHIIT